MTETTNGAGRPNEEIRPFRIEVPRADLDRMLTNVTLYWLTATAGSSAQLYHEGFHSGQLGMPREMAQADRDIPVVVVERVG